MAIATDNKHSVNRVHKFKQRLLRVSANDALPLTLKHERIYILPTPRGMAFIAVSLVMILASMNYGLNLGYALSFILIGLFSSCLLSTYLNLAGLTIRSIRSDETFAGSPLEYRIALGDKGRKSRYSISISIDESGCTVDIPESDQATLRINNTKRGEHKLGRLTISSDFPLGLWRGWGYLHTPASTIIYPAPETPLREFPASYLHNKAAAVLTNGEREFQQLKRYQKTDPQSAVAWKTVARGGGWYTKEFSTAQAAQDVEFSWASTAALSDTERRLSRLSAWIVQANANNIPFKLKLDNFSTPIGSGAQHKQRSLRQLATFESG